MADFHQSDHCVKRKSEIEAWETRFCFKQNAVGASAGAWPKPLKIIDEILDEFKNKLWNDAMILKMVWKVK